MTPDITVALTARLWHEPTWGWCWSLRFPGGGALRGFGFADQARAVQSLCDTLLAHAGGPPTPPPPRSPRARPRTP